MSTIDEATLQRAVDASLRRVFAPPADIGGLGARVLAERRSPRRTWGAIAAAAAIYVAALGGVFFGMDAEPAPLDFAGLADSETACTDELGRDWATIYAQTVAAVEQEAFACTSPGDWQAATKRSLGRGLELAEDDEVAFVTTVTLPGTDEDACFIGRCGKNLVLVIAALHGRDPRPTLPIGSALSVFDSRLGPFVLYEITPASLPRMLPHVRLAE